MSDEIKKAAEVLIKAGVRLVGLDFDAGAHFDLDTPDEAAEYVADLERRFQK